MFCKHDWHLLSETETERDDRVAKEEAYMAEYGRRHPQAGGN